MAALKPSYLVCGEDDLKIDAWRARVRKRAEAESGPGALEIFDARQHGPDRVAASLSTLSFDPGSRYVLVDGVEAWKAGVLEPLEQALAQPPGETLLLLVARGKAPARLAKAVEAGGGEVREYSAPRPWELPRWVSDRASEEGLRMDAEAAKQLVTLAGPRQARLAREVERLAVALHPRTQVSTEDVDALVHGDVAGVYDLADALVARDGRVALALAEGLTAAADERPGRLVYPLVQRLRQVHRAAELLDGGVPDQKVGSALKLPPWVAKRTLAQAKKADRDALERALCAFADLEVQIRGGGELDEDTAFTLTLAQASA